MRRYLFPVLIGIVGCAILVQLGLWQLDRRDWKEAMLDQIRQGIDAEPVPLPADIDPSMKYLPVTVAGTTSGAEIDVLSHTKEQGAGYQIVSRFITDDGRAILLDRGFVPQDDRHLDRGPTRLQVTATCTGRRMPADRPPRRTWTRTSGSPATWTPWPPS